MLKVHIYLCHGGTSLLCLASLFLLFNVSCSHAGWSTPKTVENVLPNPSWKSLTSAAAKQMGSVSKCVLKQISVSGHQKSKPQAKTWKGREWARKELAINSFADPDIRKAKTQFQWQKIIVSSLISVVVSLKCLNLSAWAPFTETVLNYVECHCAVT